MIRNMANLLARSTQQVERALDVVGAAVSAAELNQAGARRGERLYNLLFPMGERG
jgi:hypothetical protein